MRISITSYQKPKVNSRNHRTLQTTQLYEAFRMTLGKMVPLTVRYLFYLSLYNDVNATRAVIGRCP